MDCTLATLIACFSWSGLYIDSGMSWQNRGETYVTQFGTYDRNLADGLPEALPYAFSTDKPSNPYMDVSVGYSVKIENVEVSLTVRGHRSSIATGADKGFNYARLGFRWFPFR